MQFTFQLVICQLTGIQFPNLDGNLGTPLLKTTYLGHPPAKSQKGKDLAADLINLCKDYNLTLDRLKKSLVGGVFDGQYEHLSVLNWMSKNLIISRKQI